MCPRSVPTKYEYHHISYQKYTRAGGIFFYLLGVSTLSILVISTFFIESNLYLLKDWLYVTNYNQVLMGNRIESTEDVVHMFNGLVPPSMIDSDLIECKDCVKKP